MSGLALLWSSSKKETVWEGVVESFALTGCRKAKRCYAWSDQDNGETQYVRFFEVLNGWRAR
jgi:hypothetical protein